jgi:hypothetical protein
MPEKDHHPVRHASPVSIFVHCRTTRRLAFLSLTLLCLVAAPARSPAQDAGVSGIAPGPGNVNGTNGSIRDPSGIGNAAKMPALPQPSIAPVMPPTVSPSVAYQELPPPSAVRIKQARFARSKYGHAAERAAVKENNRLLDGKLTSICRGC